MKQPLQPNRLIQSVVDYSCVGVGTDVPSTNYHHNARDHEMMMAVDFGDTLDR